MNLFGVTSLLCTLTNLPLIIFTFFQEKKLVHRTFIFFTVSVAVWGYGCFLAAGANTPEQAISGWKIAFLGGILVGPSYYHLIFAFTGRKNKLILYFSYFQAICFDLIILFFPQLLFVNTRTLFGIFYPASKPLLVIIVIMYAFFVLLSFVDLIRYLRTSEGKKQKRTVFIFFGYFFGFLGGAVVLLPLIGIDAIYPFGNVGVCISDSILAYAIFRYRIMDIRTVIRRALVYLALASAISSVYVAAVFFFQSFFVAEALTSEKILNNLFLIIVIALLVKPAELYLQRILDKIFFKGSIVEISKQKEKLETELERSERLNSIGVLAAGMAHEIKNPLTAIKTFVEHLPKKYDDPEFREKFQRIATKEVARVTDIITNLLLFSKPSEPIRKECDINVIIKETLDLLSGEVLKNNIKVHTDLCDTAIAFVDSGQIKQAILNILMNAIDAMKNKGSNLSVKTQIAKKGLTIEIKDDGCGISQDLLKNIFDPFYTNKESGTGLGLAVTHSMIKKNGGIIRVESDLGVGSKFVIEVVS